jgi:hypothetical protein
LALVDAEYFIKLHNKEQNVSEWNMGLQRNVLGWC